MDYSFLIENISNRYGNEHKIVKGIIYQLSTLDEYELDIIDTLSKLENYIKNIYKNNISIKDISVKNIMTGIIYLYNSVCIIYNFPYILNTINHKSKPSIHILYNEAIAQLISVSLFTESLTIFNNLIINQNISNDMKNKINSENYKIIINDDYKLSLDIQKILTNKEITKNEFKEIFKNELESLKMKMKIKALKLCINICKYTLNFKQIDLDLIYNFIENDLNIKIE
jgi:hypothetical protein